MTRTISTAAALEVLDFMRSRMAFHSLSVPKPKASLLLAITDTLQEIVSAADRAEQSEASAKRSEGDAA